MPNSPTVGTETVDQNFGSPKPCCILCAKWVCTECWDFHRYNADRLYPQNCPNCGGIKGYFVARRHRNPWSHIGWRSRQIPRPIPTQLPRTLDEIRRLRFYA